MKNEKDIVRQIGDLIAEYKHGRLALACEVEKLVKKLIEDSKRAHTHELQELDREWREKVAGLLMGKKCDTCRWGGRYVYIKTCPFCPDGAEFNSKINQLLEEDGK